jgi:predicted lactoylglutathione lyase
MTSMTSLDYVTLEVDDLTAAERFYTAAFGLGPQVRLRASEPPTSGFRAFTLSLVVSQLATVDAFIRAALDAGATSLKPAAKQFWGGYSGVVQAPDGTIWKLATSSKKNRAPATREIDEIVLLLGVADFVASKTSCVNPLGERGPVRRGGQSPGCGPGAHPPDPLATPSRRWRAAQTARVEARPAARPSQNGTRRPPQCRRAADGERERQRQQRAVPVNVRL